jgi:hypothetical protein
MTLEKAKRAVEKAEAHKARARESLLKAIILEAGGNPRKVKKVEVTGLRSLLHSFFI